MLRAASGVDSLLVQLARATGIDMIGVAGTTRRDSVAALGATPVDYHREDVLARVRALVAHALGLGSGSGSSPCSRTCR